MSENDIQSLPKVDGQEPDSVYVDNSDLSVRFVYKAKSTLRKDTKPLVLVVGCTCPYPDNENYPYQPPVFEYLKKIASFIIKYSNQFNVPPISVAGGIADEYNTRFMPKYTRIKQSMDRYQDEYAPTRDRSSDDDNNAKIEKEYQSLKKSDPDNTHRTKFDRFYDFNAAGDYGKGNISLRTAIDLHDKYPNDSPRMTRMNLLRYVVSDEGTAHYSALNIREGQYLMGEALKPLPPRKREAVLVSYYKEGKKFYLRYLKQKQAHPTNKILAGDGCRVCFQRKEIADAIGITIKSFDLVKP